MILDSFSIAHVFKACACGACYTSTTWARLPLVGVQADDFEGDTSYLELRNCPCGSTIAILATPKGS